MLPFESNLSEHPVGEGQMLYSSCRSHNQMWFKLQRNQLYPEPIEIVFLYYIQAYSFVSLRLVTLECPGIYPERAAPNLLSNCQVGN